jgi:cysteine desulfurase/selenocysteine lyase
VCSSDLKSTFAPPPQKFEAGTPVVAQAVALAVGARYLEKLGMNAVAEHEYELTEYTVNALNALTGVRIIGPANARDRGSAVSFIVDGLHPHDVGQVLDSRGVAVRVGHHCAWPTCRRFGVPSTTRISPYIYNDTSDIDAAIDGIVAAQEFFGVK